jgi:hypothetical protein
MTWTKVVARKSARPLLLALGLLGGFPAAAGVAAAQTKPVTLSYVGYLAGFPVLSMDAQVDLPLATRSGRTVAGAGPYALDADIATEGSLASLYPYRMSVASHGRVRNGVAEPGQFHAEGQIMSKTEGVTITYGAGGHVTINAVPPTRQAQEAAAQGTANGTIDPATLVIAVVAAFAQKQDCTGTYKLFDGVRRYDLDVRQVGQGSVQMFKRSFYAGPATECQATPQLLQGFQQMAVQSQLYPQSANLWLADAVPNYPAIPVRIETQDALGKMVFDLVNVQ